MSPSLSLTLLAVGPGLCVCVGAIAAAAWAVVRRSRLWAALALTSCLLILPAGGLGWSYALSRAFAATATADPSEKAVLLAEGISAVMSGVAGSFAAVLLAAMVCLGAVFWVWSRTASPQGAPA